jgi:hypothetical protein
MSITKVLTHNGKVITLGGNKIVTHSYVDALTTATGGTYSTDGDYTILTFLDSGIIKLTENVEMDILVIGGGGGGGRQTHQWCSAGGGAGGHIYMTGYTLNAGTYNLTVGSGGTGANGTDGTYTGNKGGNSILNDIIAYGGGGGAGVNYTDPTQPTSGASGGGGARGNKSSTPYVIGADGIAGQGYKGGNGGAKTEFISPGGGGGGSSSAGVDADEWSGGNGGDGTYCAINGVNTYRAGGGGGAGTNNLYGYVGLGKAGGGNGLIWGQANGNHATANSGSGGGGGGSRSGDGSGYGGNGGSGIIILRYKTPA